MKRRVAAWRWGWLAGCALLWVGASALAQDTRLLKAGDTAVLAETPASSPISDVSAKFGRAEAKATPDGKRSQLAYTAPGTGTSTDTVKYTESAVQKTIDISITGAGPSAKTLMDADTYEPAFKILFAIFVLALVLESGLAVLFNWRPFVMTFDARGVKTLVSLAFALFFVSVFHLDLCTELINILWAQKNTPRGAGYFITALILAGGSSAVNSLMVSLGLRSVKTVETVVPKPPPTKAWIAVALKRASAVGAVQVLLTEGAGPAKVVGSIHGSSPHNALARLFLRDEGRFPNWGGLAVYPDKSYFVHLAGYDIGRNAIVSPQTAAFVPAAGAIVDLTLEL